MLLTLAVWVPLASACLGIGAAIAGWIRPPSPFLRREDKVLAQLWLGLFALCSALLMTSFFGPVQPLYLVGAGIAFLPKLRQIPGNAAWIVLVAAASSAGPVRLFDTGLYHHQLIQWLARHGTVAGMADFYHRLGFSSSWFALNAATGTETAAGGFVLALLLAHGCLAVARWRAGQAESPDRLWLGALPVLLAVNYLHHFHVSPSPNLPAAAAVVAVGWLFLLRQPELALACAGAAAALKISVFPLLAASILRHRRAMTVALLAAAPVLLANWIASGHPFYPLAIQSSGKAGYSSWETMVWARYGGQIVPGAVFWDLDWIIGWILRPVNAVAVVLATIGFASSGGRLTVVAAAGCLGWFATAPDIRLGFGYLALLSGAAFPNRRFRLPAASWLIGFVSLELALRPAIVSRMSPNDPLSFSWQHLTGPAYIRSVPAKLFRQSDRTYSMPEGTACWDAPFPCTLDTSIDNKAPLPP